MGRTGGNQRTYSANPTDYKLLEEVGYGASATVYRAVYLPFNEVVAVKCLDLDRCNSNLDDIRREAQTMSLIDHPNVVKAFCSFVVERNLWVVMPFMAEGSCLHLMKIAYPDGFEEAAIASILKETLKALEYLHRQGHIHRDVKAGNILLDSNGMVKLADFGVSACMFDAGDRQRSRNTFVGTPCWMAPEVLQPGSGYNFKADIWSFGITALELAHGHAPFSKYPPMKVLLMTIQNAPPGLDYDRDKRFSKSFKEMVAMCLVKDQAKRPTAEKLLKHSFFKQAKPPELSLKKLFADLPTLWNRVKALQLKDAAQLALKKMPSAEQEALSMSEYQRGVSAWNFDIEDLKAQASLVRDDDDMQEMREEDESMKSFVFEKDTTDSQSRLGQFNINNELEQSECRGQTSAEELPRIDCLDRKEKKLDGNLLESGYQEKVVCKKNVSSAEASSSAAEKDMVLAKTKTQMVRSRQTQSGPLTPAAVLSHSLSERGRISERSENEIQPSNEKAFRDVRRAPSFSGPLMLPNRASANSLSAPIKPTGGFRDSLDDKSKANLVQIKGRFSVTSENLDIVKDIPLSTVPRRSQGSPLRKSASVGDWSFDSKQVPVSQSSKDFSNSNLPASLLMPHLQNLFQQTAIQQDLIVNLLNSLQSAEVADATQNGKLPPLPRNSENNGIIETAASERERLLHTKILELQARMTNLTGELTAEKLKYIQFSPSLCRIRTWDNQALSCNSLCPTPRHSSGSSARIGQRERKKKIRNGTCRAELSDDAPFVAAIGACILSSLFFPVTSKGPDGEGDSGFDLGDTRFSIMGIISFIPFFNWLSWVFAWLDTGNRRFAVYALVYLAPYLRSNFSLSPEESWLPLVSILLCVIHVQLEASIKNGDIQGFQFFSKTANYISSTSRKKDHLKGHGGISEEGRKSEDINLPSAEEQSRNEIQRRRASKKQSEDREPSNGDWFDDDRKH